MERIDLIDLDPAMTDLGTKRHELLRLNQGSLLSPRVHIENVEAMQHLRTTHDFYDVVFVDLPDPDSEALAKLYSTAFYALVEKHLSAHGLFVT